MPVRKPVDFLKTVLNRIQQKLLQKKSPWELSEEFLKRHLLIDLLLKTQRSANLLGIQTKNILHEITKDAMRSRTKLSG